MQKFVIGILVFFFLVEITEARGFNDVWFKLSERDAITTKKRDFEITIGSGKSKIGYEREEGYSGWLYDVILKKTLQIKTVETRFFVSDRNRNAYIDPVSWQTIGYMIINNIGYGVALTGDSYTNWKGNLKIGIVYSKNINFWIFPLFNFKLFNSTITDLKENLRWENIIDLEFILDKNNTLNLGSDYWGDSRKVYGRTGLKLIHIFN